MGHDHHGHSHGPSADADRKWLTIALALIAGFMVVEVVVGIIASSLALLSDAAHMLTDAGAIGLALFAATLAARPPSKRYTFGLGRAEILSAQFNGATLLVLAGVLAIEAIRRLFDPPDVEGGLVIIVGALGACVNIAAAWALSRSERRGLNVEGAMAHILMDLYGSVAAIVAGVIIVTTGWGAADGIAALTVSALMLRSGWSLLRDSGRILLEGSPKDIDPDEVGRVLARADGIVEVHDLHVWEVTSGFPALAAHVLVAEGDDCHARRGELERLLHDRFGIDHTTLQVDHEHEPRLLSITPRSPYSTADERELARLRQLPDRPAAAPPRRLRRVIPRPLGRHADEFTAAAQRPGERGAVRRVATARRTRSTPPAGEIDPEDLQLALYCCYELHYRGFEGVDDAWEWEPSLLAFRGELERRFEAELLELVGHARRRRRTRARSTRCCAS